jgi:AcrR family transcriptional regulator
MRRRKQIDESKQMIVSALVELLADYSYDDLTLSQIADHAGVTRMTLYRHFKTKERIVLYQAQRRLKELSARFTNDAQPVRSVLVQQLDHVRNLPQLAVLLRSHEIEELLDQFRMDSYTANLEQFLGRRFHDDPYLFHFYFGGVNRIIREWLRNDCRESSEEIADRIVAITRSFVVANRA